jgi:hypothetical protein
VFLLRQEVLSSQLRNGGCCVCGGRWLVRLRGVGLAIVGLGGRFVGCFAVGIVGRRCWFRRCVGRWSWGVGGGRGRRSIPVIGVSVPFCSQACSGLHFEARVVVGTASLRLWFVLLRFGVWFVQKMECFDMCFPRYFLLTEPHTSSALEVPLYLTDNYIVHFDCIRT